MLTFTHIHAAKTNAAFIRMECALELKLRRRGEEVRSMLCGSKEMFYEREKNEETIISRDKKPEYRR